MLYYHLNFYLLKEKYHSYKYIFLLIYTIVLNNINNYYYMYLQFLNPYLFCYRSYLKNK